MQAEIFKQLSHPSRLCIMVNLIAKKESNVSNMQNCLCEPQSTVSQHISKLKSAGLLKGERNGTEIVYRISNEQVKELLILLLKQLNKGEFIE
jgi:ArsR family transcriptional regulator